MSKLDKLDLFEKLDESKMRDSISALGKQVAHAWEDTKKITVPEDYKDINKIVVSGMGGSALGADVVRNVFRDKLKLPIWIVNDYELPEFVDEKTLVIFSSYSGTTEEPLNTFDQALKRKAKMMGITTGGRLKDFFEETKLPYYNIDPKFNPCGQPRMALGYSIIGQLGLLVQAGLIEVTDEEIAGVVSMLEGMNEKLNYQVETTDNLSKQLADKLHDKIPAITGSEFLKGNLHACANQINENAKQFSYFFLIPELNHHLMEGLGNPEKGIKSVIFILAESKLYHKSNQIRYDVTKDIITKNNGEYLEIKLEQPTKLLQSFEFLIIGSYIAYYMSILNDINPSPIPYVEMFKEELEKRK